MRQVVFDKFFIFSACLANVNDNHLRTREVYNYLMDKGYNFSCVTGVYKGVTEASFFVHDSEGLEDDIKALCKTYGQESYLVREKDNEGFLVYSDGSKEYLGVPKEVTRLEARELESFTILPQKDNVKKYFTFVKEQ